MDFYFELRAIVEAVLTLLLIVEGYVQECKKQNFVWKKVVGFFNEQDLFVEECIQLFQ